MTLGSGLFSIVTLDDSALVCFHIPILFQNFPRTDTKFYGNPILMENYTAAGYSFMKVISICVIPIRIRLFAHTYVFFHSVLFTKLNIVEHIYTPMINVNIFTPM